MSSPRSIERDLSAPSATAVAPRLPRLPRGAWLPAVLLLGAVVVSSAIYLSRLGREFVFDDFATIVSNTGIRTLARGVRAFGLQSSDARNGSDLIPRTYEGERGHSG